MASTSQSASQATTSDTKRRAKSKVKHSLFAAFREFSQHTNPRILAGLVAISMVGRLWVGGLSLWDAVIPLVLLALWPFQEWAIHVFILHMKPVKIGPWTFDPLVARTHRYHHEHPWEIPRVFVPIKVTLMLVPVVIAVWWLVTPTWSLFWTGMTCYTIMGLLYEWTHYLIHSRYRPKSAFYKKLWQHHRWHHCKNEHYWFGVTMTAGDQVLGTAPDQKDVESSPTCRNLGVGP